MIKDVLEAAAVICKAKDHLMQVETKHPIRLGIAIKKDDEIGIAVGIHEEEENQNVLKDIVGHVLRLSEMELITDHLLNELQDMIVYYHKDK